MTASACSTPRASSATRARSPATCSTSRTSPTPTTASTSCCRPSASRSRRGRGGPRTELVRVCKPGGTLALAAWAPRGLPGGLEEHVARPHGIVSPALWGDEERARERLEPLLHGLTVRLRTVRIEFPTADEHVRAARPAARGTLRAPFDELLARNSASRGSAATAARYLLITGTVA